jgi:hypothetical protein
MIRRDGRCDDALYLNSSFLTWVVKIVKLCSNL